MTLDNGDRDYWKGVDLGDEFDQCKEEINEAIVSFQQGVTDYFKGEYSYIKGKHVVSNKMEERCANDEHYESGVNFAHFLNSIQSDMSIDGIDN